MYFLTKLNQKSLGLGETQTVRSKVNTSQCGEILLTTPPPILLRGVSRNQTDSSGTTLKWQLPVTCGVTHPELPAPNPKHPRILSKQQPYQERKKILKNWQYLRASLVAQWIRIYLIVQGTWVSPWSRKNPHAAEQLGPGATTTDPCA